MDKDSPTPLAPICDATDAVVIASRSLSLFPATDPKAGANPTEASPDSSTSAQPAAIQVFDGDGRSPLDGPIRSSIEDMVMSLSVEGMVVAGISSREMDWSSSPDYGPADRIAKVFEKSP
jgi:hypothetical protein